MQEYTLFRENSLKVDITDATFIFFAYLVYPIAGLAFAIILSANCKAFTQTVLAFVVASFAFALVPTIEDDLYRWYDVYFDFNGKWLDYLWGYISEKPDSLMYIYAFFLSYIGLPKQLIPFFSVSLAYSLWLTVLRNYILSGSYSKRVQVIFYLIFIFWIDYRVVLLGVRQGAAIFIAVYGTVLYFKSNRSQGFLITVAASTIHLMTIVVPVFLLLSHFLSIKTARKVLLISIPFLFFANSEMVGFIFKALPFGLGKFTLDYTSGYWAKEYLLDRSFKGLIQVYIKDFAIYVTLIYLVFIKNISELRRFIYILGSFVCFVSPYANIFSRYGWLLYAFLPVLLLSEYKDEPKKNMFAKFVLGLSVFLFLCMLYSFREILENAFGNLFLSNGISMFLLD